LANLRYAPFSSKTHEALPGLPAEPGSQQVDVIEPDQAVVVEVMGDPMHTGDEERVDFREASDSRTDLGNRYSGRRHFLK
jgi:hypothetical protein